MKLNRLFAVFVIVFVLCFSLNNLYSIKHPGAAYRVHDPLQPQPKKVTPGKNNSAPSDAIVLFDGKNLDQWQNEEGGATTWEIVDGAMRATMKGGEILTKQAFGDCQLRIEWRIPTAAEEKAYAKAFEAFENDNEFNDEDEQEEHEDQGEEDEEPLDYYDGAGQELGNSGIFLMGLYEVQVLHSYNRKTYPDGQAGALYGQHAPLVNATKPEGQWQTYDIIFHRPRFNSKGEVVKKATFTVIHNGVLIHYHKELYGISTFCALAEYEKHPDKLPIRLQWHGNPVQYRNIWIREL